MRIALLCILLSMVAGTEAIAQPDPQLLETQLLLKWKTYIGLTTFKTNMVVNGGHIYVGSNGHHFKDYFLDHDNGVCILDARTGKLQKRLADETFGDMDVNGVVLDGDHIYFGNDNEEMLCYNTKGQLLWRMPASGDVEAQPVLIDANSDCVNDVVYATESGEIACLDSRTGNVLWSFKTKDFTGWKKTDSRFVFKVNAWFNNGPGFMNKPAVVDLNHDGIPDVVYSARDGFAYAVNGKTGALLWKYEHNISFNSITPSVQQKNGKTLLYLPSNIEEGKSNYNEYLVCLDENGHVIDKVKTGFDVSTDALPLSYKGKFITVSYDSILAIDMANHTVLKQPLGINNNKYNEKTRRWYHASVTMTPILIDLMGFGSNQLVVMDQSAKVYVLDPVSLVTLREFKLPDGTEANPLVADIDGDGKLEMLVSSYDGFLYCFSLGKGKLKS